MPIGLGTAVTAGAAILGAGATIYAGSQANHAQSQAAQTAADSQLAATEQNNALAEQIYNQNAARLDPYSAMGLPAGGEYNALLGIATPASTSPSATPVATSSAGAGGTQSAAPPSSYTGPSLDQIMAMQHDGIPGNYEPALQAYYAANQPTAAQISAMQHDGIPGNYAAATAAGSRPAAAPASIPAPTPAASGAQISPANALAGFQTFYNSPTYQFPLQQGLHAVNVGYAAKGALESGAAMKAINDYAANNAAGALGTYMDQLYRQEALGESASSALAGVGQNMVGQVSANNNNAASAAGNAALVAGQGSANMWNTVGSGIGQAAGTIAGAMGSSYHPSNALAANYDFSNPNNSIYDGLNLAGGIY